MHAAKIIYRKAAAGEIQGLRGAILRSATGVLVFKEDDAPPPKTWHFGAFLPEDSQHCVACATFLASSYQERAAMQLRGMAVAEEFRGAGVGGKLLEYAEKTLIADNVKLLWCNARVSAIRFYEKHGWRIASGEFMVESAGPHRVMVKE